MTNSSAEEKVLGQWTVNYFPKKGKYLGTLTVTDKNLYFDSRFDLGTIAKGAGSISALGTLADALGLSHAIVVWRENGAGLAIRKQDIAKVTAKRSFIINKVAVELKDKTELVFNYGILPVGKIVEAIRIKL